jgi:hypothetical protein
MLTGHDLPNVIHRPGMRKVCELTPYLDGLWARMKRASERGHTGTMSRMQRMMVRHGRAQAKRRRDGP